MESMISTNYISKVGNCSSSDHESSWDFEEFNYSYRSVKKNEDDDDDDDDCVFSASEASSMASLINHGLNDNERRLINFSAAKRRKTQSKSSFVDRDLEDTATSPDHTPNLNNFSIFQKPTLIFQELHKQQQGGPGSSQGIKKREDMEDGTELRKKGLCLVPLSIFVDYYTSLN